VTSSRRKLAALLERFHRRLAKAPPGGSLRARTLVFAPHPDDEVLGCGGVIALKRREGAVVRVVFTTDGSASHAGLMDGRELARLRRAEAIEAGRELGLKDEEHVFLDFPDQGLQGQLEDAVARIAALLAEFRPEEVYVPHRRDRISDHVATYEAVSMALDRYGLPVALFEYPVWLWNTRPWTEGMNDGASRWRALLRDLVDNWRLAVGCSVRVDVSAVAERKLRALACHRSQVERMRGEGWPVLGDVSEGDFLRCFETGAERFALTRRN
jgi:LmbE family N-acetylglucosaminyl deacetylase